MYLRNMNDGSFAAGVPRNMIFEAEDKPTFVPYIGPSTLLIRQFVTFVNMIPAFQGLQLKDICTSLIYKHLPYPIFQEL